MLEILVTFGIVALGVGISLTFLRVYQSSAALENTARALAGDLRYGAELASTTQVNHAVRLYPSTSTYEVVRMSVPEVIVKRASLPSTITFSSITFTDNLAEFNLLGAATASGTITLRHTNQSLTTIEVRPSGYVQVQ